MVLNKLITRFRQGLYLRKEFVSVEKLPFSFAHISDLHFDETGKLPSWIQNNIKDYLYVNPTDLLCVTGDLIDGTSDNVEQALTYLTNLPVNYLVVSLGNHDEKFIDKFISHSFRNPKIKLSVNGSFLYKGLNFVCLADIHSKYHDPSYTKYMNNIHPNVILAHNPQQFWHLVDSITPNYKCPLFISGHTHGGQIGYADFLRNVFQRFIKNGKILNTLRINHEHDCFQLQGSYKLDDLHLHINTGLGSHPPGRFFCPPTITIYN